MTGVPHPFFMVVDSELRRLQYLAEADRDRLAKQASGSGNWLPRWADVAAVLAFVVVVMLMLASLAGPEGAAQAQQQIGAHDPRTVTQVVEKHLLDPIAIDQPSISLL